MGTITFAQTLDELVAAMLAAFDDVRHRNNTDLKGLVIENIRPMWRIYCRERIAKQLMRHQPSLERLAAKAREIGYVQEEFLWRHETIELLKKEGFNVPKRLKASVSLSRPQVVLELLKKNEPPP